MRIRICPALLLWVFSALYFSPILCFAEVCKDNSIVIQEMQSPYQVTFFLTSQRTLASTVIFRSTALNNMVPSHVLPYTFVVNQPYSQREFLRFIPRNAQEHWSYGAWNYHFEIGIPSQNKTIDYEYSLPYASDRHFRVNQSYFGKFSHFAGSQDEYAVDFGMPEDTPVLAARPGIVIAYKDDSEMHGNTPDFASCANYVVVQHVDGTYANYNHLKYKSVMAKLGQQVSVGTLLGLSGFTGCATCPHLHFKVYRVKSADEIESMPFRMRTPQGVLPELQEGKIY